MCVVADDKGASLEVTRLAGTRACFCSESYFSSSVGSGYYNFLQSPVTLSAMADRQSIAQYEESPKDVHSLRSGSTQDYAGGLANGCVVSVV